MADPILEIHRQVVLDLTGILLILYSRKNAACNKDDVYWDTLYRIYIQMLHLFVSWNGFSLALLSSLSI